MSLKEKLENVDLTEMFAQSRYLQPYYFYYKINKIIPNKIALESCDIDSVLSNLKERYCYIENQVIKSQISKFSSNEKSFASVVVILKQNLMVYNNPGVNYEVPNVQILYDETTDLVEVEELESLILKHRKKLEVESNRVHLLSLLSET